MVGVYSPTLSPWLAWTSYGLMSMAETFPGFIGDRGAPLVVEGTKQWAQVSLPTHPETEMHMFLFKSEKHKNGPNYWK